MIFLSKVRELRLVIKPKWVIKDPQVGVQIHDGKSIQFMDGRYETNDPEEIEFIKGRSNFGSKITSVEEGDIPTGAKGPVVVTGSMGGGATEAKRTFKCLRCGMDGFESGFEVAEHRKTGECDVIRQANMEDESTAEEE